MTHMSESPAHHTKDNDCADPGSYPRVHTRIRSLSCVFVMLATLAICGWPVNLHAQLKRVNGNQDLSQWVQSGTLTSDIEFFKDNSTLFIDSGVGNVTIAGEIFVKLSRSPSTMEIVAESDFDDTLSLSADNSYQGDITINGGVIELSGSGRIGNGNFSGALSLGSNGTFEHNGSSAQSMSGTISGSGAMVLGNSGTLTLSGNNTYSGGTTIDAGAGTLILTNANAAGSGSIIQSDANSILRFNTTGTIANDMTLYNFESLQNITLSGSINSQDATYKIATGTETILSGNITGTGKLSQAGAGDSAYQGTLTLSGTNNYEGDTEVDSVLNVGSSGALSANSKLTVNTGGMVKLNSFDSRVAALEGAGTIQGSATLTAGDESNATFSGVLEDGTGGGLSLTKEGSGTMTLSGVNAFTGDTTVTSGTLEIAGSGVLGSGDYSSSITVDSGGMLKFSTDANQTLSGALSGAGDLVKQGTGTLTLSGTNSFTGTTSASAGVLALNSSGTAITGDSDTSTVDLEVSGGTVRVDADNQLADDVDVSISSGTFNLNGSSDSIDGLANSGGVFTTGIGGTLTVLGNTVTWSGGTNTINAGATVQDTHWDVSGGTNTVDGDGGTTSGGGTLHVQGGGIGFEFTGSGTPNITLNSDNTAAGRMLLEGKLSVASGYTGTGATITSGGAGSIAGYIDLGGGSRTFEINNSANAVDDLTVSAVITNGGITKTGAGTLVLEGTNTYTGATDINAGTLLINASNAGATGDYTIGIAGGDLADAATLGGTGSIGGATTLTNTGYLSPGDGGIGSISFLSSLDIADATTGSLIFDLGAAGSGDTVNVTGQLSIGDGLLDMDDFAFNNLGATSVTGTYTWNLFQVGSFDFTNLGSNTTSTPFGSIKSATLAISGDFVQLTMTVPEPSSTALLGLGGLMLAFRRKRS